MTVWNPCKSGEEEIIRHNYMCEKKKTKESSETRKWERIFVPRMNLLTSDINRHILIYIRQFPVTPSTCTYIFLYCFNLTMIQILMNVEIVVKITVLMSSKEYKTWSLYTSRKKNPAKEQSVKQQLPTKHIIYSDWKRGDVKTHKLTTVYLPYGKDLSEKIPNICRPFNIRRLLMSNTKLRRYLRVKPLQKATNKGCVYFIPCRCCRLYGGERCRSLKIKVEKLCKVEKLHQV